MLQTPPPCSEDDLLHWLDARGDLAYDGEPVTQLQHAWQCAQLARQAGASPALQLAAWLHDIGHLRTTQTGSPTLDGVDDAHENTGAAIVLPLYGEDVAGPVRWHVLAKRYLVRQQSGYLEQLSADSLRSLALQGGPMDAAECAQFRVQPGARDALRLRAWDDLAKRAGWFSDKASALAELRDLMRAVRANA